MIITPKTYTTTYIKFGSAPSGPSDYDAYANYPNGIVGDTTYTNQTIVYVWGTSGYAGQIKINGTFYMGGWAYNSAISFNLTGNYDIELVMGNTPYGGGA